MPEPIHSTARATIYALFGFLAALICIYLYYSFLASHSPGSLFTMDQLNFVDIYRDVIQNRNPFSDWTFTPTPYFFPDAAIYFLIAPFVHSIGIGAILCGAIFLIVFYLLVIGTGCLITHDWKNHYLFSLSAILGLSLAANGHLWDGLFSPLWVSHFGSTVLMYLISAALIVKILQQPRWIYALLLVVIIAVTALSDPLFTVVFTVPAIISLIILAHQIFIPKKSAYLISLYLLLGTAGALLIRKFHIFGVDIGHYQLPHRMQFQLAMQAIDKLHEIFTLFYTDNAIVAILVIFYCIFCLGFMSKVMLGKFAIVKNEFPWKQSEGFFLLLVFLTIILTIIASIFSDGDLMLSGFYSLRHYDPLILITAFVAVPVLLARFTHLNLYAKQFYVPVLLSITLSALFFNQRGNIADLVNYAPPQMHCLDEYAQKENLHNGIAENGAARVLSLLSKSGLNVLAVNSNDLSPYTWMTTRHNYRNVRFDFALLNATGSDALSPATVKKVLGEPDSQLQCPVTGKPELTIYVYRKGFTLKT